MKKIKYILAIGVVALGMATSSCTNFLDVNKNQNQITDDNITPDLIFTQAENAIGTRQASRFVFLNNWMGYWGRSGTFIVEQEESTYKATATFPETNWDQAYDILYDLYLTKTKALAIKDSVLVGASMILSAKLWQETVDQFGDIPYNQAFQNLKYPQPQYDKATDIYADLLVKLDSAIYYLNVVHLDATNAKRFGKTDIIFSRQDGTQNLSKSVIALWKKLANTIKLRIFIRKSETGFNPSPAQLAKIKADGGFLKAGDDVSVNPGYANQDNKQNPFYGSFAFTPSGSPATSNNTPNNYFLKTIMPGDPRITKFFAQPATGTDYGALGGDHTLSQTVVGTTVGPNALAPQATSDQFIFPSFESLFLQAEATYRGWLTDDIDSVAWINAVTQSFIWLGADPSDVTAYLGDKYGSWSSLTADQKLSAIMLEKYVAMCGVDAVEAWSDLRRLGDKLGYLPDGYLSWNAQRAAHLPYVLPYPQTEITSNGANVPDRNANSIFTEKIFWQP
jgi:hypothetical protein